MQGQCKNGGLAGTRIHTIRPPFRNQFLRKINRYIAVVFERL